MSIIFLTNVQHRGSKVKLKKGLSRLGKISLTQKLKECSGPKAIFPSLCPFISLVYLTTSLIKIL